MAAGRHGLRLAAPLAVALLLLVAAGCGSGGDSGAPPSRAAAARFGAHAVDNPWFPLTPGTTLVYRGVKDGEPSRELFTVTRRHVTVQGVRCTVVSDRLYLRGQLEERTRDFYAQDEEGDVWYFGEDTAELRPNGAVKTTEGTWRAGRDGALAGVFMPAEPRVGQTFRQEYYRGHAEDHFRVVRVRGHVATPGASSDRALVTEEWTPLEPGVRDRKYYVRGIGTVLERTVRGGDERNTLVAVRRAAR